MKADGSDIQQLTSPEHGTARPPNHRPVSAWSPDGSRLAFALIRDDSSHIYLIDRDGTGLTQLTSSGTLNAEPAWSPDGRRLAFVSNRSGKTDICLLEISDGTQICPTESSPNNSPAWSPDGSRIVFSCFRANSYDICAMNADGSAQTFLTQNELSDMQPAWSPDGSRIAYMSAADDGPADGDSQTSGFNIHLMNADGSGQTRLTDGYADYSPAWSPEGATILYSTFDYGGSGGQTITQLKLVSASGGAPVHLGDGYEEGFGWRPRP